MGSFRTNIIGLLTGPVGACWGPLGPHLGEDTAVAYPRRIPPRNSIFRVCFSHIYIRRIPRRIPPPNYALLWGGGFGTWTYGAHMGPFWGPYGAHGPLGPMGVVMAVRITDWVPWITDWVLGITDRH